MELRFVDINGFNGKYEISIESPHVVREKITHRIIDEWYNGYGDVAVLLNGELYLIDSLRELCNANELLQLIN